MATAKGRTVPVRTPQFEVKAADSPIRY